MSVSDKTEQQRRRSIHNAIVAALRHFDPLGHAARFSGERGEGHLYSYEATTILERLRERRTAEAVQHLLQELAGPDAVIDPARLKEAASQVAKVLARLQV